MFLYKCKTMIKNLINYLKGFQYCIYDCSYDWLCFFTNTQLWHNKETKYRYLIRFNSSTTVDIFFIRFSLE